MQLLIISKHSLFIWSISDLFKNGFNTYHIMAYKRRRETSNGLEGIWKRKRSRHTTGTNPQFASIKREKERHKPRSPGWYLKDEIPVCQIISGHTRIHVIFASLYKSESRYYFNTKITPYNLLTRYSIVPIIEDNANRENLGYPRDRITRNFIFKDTKIRSRFPLIVLALT